MNREGRRTFTKKAVKSGFSKGEAAAMTAIVNEGVGTVSKQQDIREGEKVKLNVDLIKARKQYSRMATKYKEFVEQNRDAVLTAHVEKENLISMVEEPRWLFWSGDLIKLEENGEDVDDE